MIEIVIAGIIAAILLYVILFVAFSPAFGGVHSEEKRRVMQSSKQYMNGKFQNTIPTSMNMDAKSIVSLLKDQTKGKQTRQPDWDIPIQRIDPASIGSADKLTKVTWFGHSALLVEMDGKVLLIDPMLGPSPSPHPLFGGKRYSRTLPIEIDELPFIDAILISHDHYDHLDYASMKQLIPKTGQFFTPLGVGSHLERWGAKRESIHELDWWDERQFEGLTFACTPARHFSGRGLTNRFSTLWCSWVIKGAQTNIYFSADSGYGPHFKEIGETYGPFDMTFMECGQYDPRWAAIHMLPEESVQAHLDVKGNVMVPIHWAAFTLSLHSWTDPIERATKEGTKQGVTVATPKIGETMVVGDTNPPNERWWISKHIN